MTVTDISAAFDFNATLGILSAKKFGKMILCTIGVDGTKLNTINWNTIATLTADTYKPHSGSSLPGNVSVSASADAGKHMKCTYSLVSGNVDVRITEPLVANIFIQLIWFVK